MEVIQRFKRKSPTKITNFKKFTIICLPIHEICEVYSEAYMEVPNEICENYKFSEIYENWEIYENSPAHLQNIRIFFIPLQVFNEISKITNVTKFTKSSKFMLIRQAIHKIYEIYSKGCKEGPKEAMKSTNFYEIYENCEFYDYSSAYPRNFRNLFTGLQGR